MTETAKDFVSIHAQLSPSSHYAHKIESQQWLKVAILPGKGRGFVAKQPIPAGTVVHTAAPLAAVVSQEWTPETCAWCFAFSYPKRMRVKVDIKQNKARPTTIKDILFCSNECKEQFERHGYENESLLFLRCCDAFEQAIQERKKADRKGNHESLAAQLTTASINIENDEELATWLDNVWTKVTNELRSMPLCWLPENSERTMCRLIAMCLSRRQCQAEYVLPDPTVGNFDDLWQIQCNELDHYRHLVRKNSQQDLLEIMQLYVFFANAVSGIIHDCPHTLFRAIYFRERANSFGLWEMPHHNSATDSDDGVTDDLELLGWGIYPSAVYFNHACDANVAKIRDGRLMKFVARRDIEEGEEAFISYGSVGESVRDRQQRLLEHYHFLCACKRCKNELLQDQNH